MKKNATTKAPKVIKNTGCLKTKNTPKTSKNTPKRKRETVTVSNYQRLAMRTCLPECKSMKYASPELWSEWHEAFAKIEGMRAKEVRLDGKSNIKEWKAQKLREIRDELGDVFWTVALVCELKKESFASIFKKTKPLEEDGAHIIFIFQECGIGFELDFEISRQIATLKKLCYSLGIKPSDCMRANIAKLAKRQAQGKLRGDGDKR
jgi:hypothetical protein